MPPSVLLVCCWRAYGLPRWAGGCPLTQTAQILAYHDPTSR
ncbi:MAG: hypothetical protein O2784_05285 [Proteobacteria bacterium]|nr:hypothetical protein [Pseudomonadota bacterium]